MIIITILAGLAVLVAVSLPFFKRDMQMARIRQKEFHSKLTDSPTGLIEYADMGEGIPVLSVHGAAGGYDQGIIAAAPILNEGYHIIAPSRFGYQHTELPANPSPAVQADAHAALLDSVGIRKAFVFGFSAGAPSCVEMAIRHPERVAGLVLFVPLAYTPNPPQEKHKVSVAFMLASIFKSDYILWLGMMLTPGSILNTIGMPGHIRQRFLKAKQLEYMNWVLPYKTRIKGMMNDGHMAMALQPSQLEKISVPTLIFSTKDDPWKTWKGAQYMAEKIPTANFIGFEDGGHLLNGREEEVKNSVLKFVKENTTAYLSEEAPVIPMTLPAEGSL